MQSLVALVGVKSEALVSKLKHQLYEYLETYSEGQTHSMVMSGGPMNAVEAFRQFCDEGFSARDRNLRNEYRKVAHSKQAAFEWLKRAILDWENELARYEVASGTTMSEADKVMGLENIRPDIFQQHVETKANLTGYAAYETVINDFLFNRSRWVGRSRLNWLGFSEPAAEEGEDDQRWEEEEERVRQIEALISQSAQLSAVSAGVSAILRSKFGKRPPKGTGKRGGQRVHTYRHTYVHKCTHTQTHTDIHAYIHTCIHTHIHTYIHTYMHAYIHARIHTYIHAHIHSHIHTHTYLHTHIRTHTYVHACVHACMHAYIHAFIHTYVHTYIHPRIHAYIHTHMHIHIHAHTCTHTYIHTYTHA